MSTSNQLQAQLKNIENNLIKAMSENKEQVVEKLNSGAKIILDDSQSLVPVLSGNLKSSGKVNRLKNGAEIEYTAPYAVDVHENLSVPHDDGQAKFLEQPFVNRVKDVCDSFGGRLV